MSLKIPNIPISKAFSSVEALASSRTLTAVGSAMLSGCEGNQLSLAILVGGGVSLTTLAARNLYFDRFRPFGSQANLNHFVRSNARFPMPPLSVQAVGRVALQTLGFQSKKTSHGSYEGFASRLIQAFFENLRMKVGEIELLSTAVSRSEAKVDTLDTDLINALKQELDNYQETIREFKKGLHALERADPQYIGISQEFLPALSDLLMTDHIKDIQNELQLAIRDIKPASVNSKLAAIHHKFLERVKHPV